MLAIVLSNHESSLVSERFPELPPCLIPVANKPFLYWLTKWLQTQGFLHIVYFSHFHPEKIAAWANQLTNSEHSLCLDVLSANHPLGTAGAAALCAHRFPSTATLIVNSDSLLLFPLQEAIAKLKTQPNLDGVMVATTLYNVGRFNKLIVNQEDYLVALKKKEPGYGIISVGTYLLRSELLLALEVNKVLSLEEDCFPEWISLNKKIAVCTKDAPFIDINTPETLQRAHKLIAANQSMIVGQPFSFPTD